MALSRLSEVKSKYIQKRKGNPVAMAVCLHNSATRGVPKNCGGNHHE